MSDHFQKIYAAQAEMYERLVSREDQRGNLFAVLMDVVPTWDNKTVVEFSAGTGRITRILSVLARQIHAFDISPHMLQTAARIMIETGMMNWGYAVADNLAMPLPDNFADVAIEGWGFGHIVDWSPENWQQTSDQMIGEMQRVLRPGGTAILIETMGTGNRQPQPPTDGLASLYQRWQEIHGFEYRWIRTDYQFASVTEADELTRFFFGDALADQVVEKKQDILPECTGIWWRVLE